MKSNYSFRRINSPFDDSGIFLRNVYMKKAKMFDCGRLGNIDNSELNDVSDVFITHTHLDHFIGFDRFLRGTIALGNSFNFYGPAGFIKNVRGKLDGYTWNLIKDYTISFHVYEITEEGINSSIFSAKNEFAEVKVHEKIDSIEIENGFKLKYEFFDHGITTLGYRLCEPERISINKDKMKSLGIKNGVWVGNFLKELELKSNDNISFEIESENGKKSYYTNELKYLLVEYPETQDITYITDIAPIDKNIEKAIEFAKNSFILIVESVFMDRDFEHAKLKNHLTLSYSKKIYTESNSEFVSFGHFAPKYDRCKDELFSELYDGLNKEKVIKFELDRNKLNSNEYLNK